MRIFYKSIFTSNLFTSFNSLQFAQLIPSSSVLGVHNAARLLKAEQEAWKTGCSASGRSTFGVLVCWEHEWVVASAFRVTGDGRLDRGVIEG